MSSLPDISKKLKYEVLELINREENDTKKDFLINILNSIDDNHHTSADEILIDLLKVHSMFESNKRVSGLFHVRKALESSSLSSLIIKFFLYETDSFTLSDIVKILDDFKIRIKDHLSYLIFKTENLIVHEFVIEDMREVIDGVGDSCLSNSFFETFESVLTKKWISSAFNKLSILSCMAFNDIKLLAVIKRYLKHISRRFDSELLANLTGKRPEIFLKFIELFHYN
jgi:NAD-specific glutamate dehydrogenase